MSGSWVMKKMEAEARKASGGGPPPEKQPEPPLVFPAANLGKGKLPEHEWNFDKVPDEEIWACLIWEYGRSSDSIPSLLPKRGGTDEERATETGRFHQSQPTVALNLLNKMLLQQWVWSEDQGVQQIEFFPNASWIELPPIVKANMRRAVEGLEPLADLSKLPNLLTPETPYAPGDQVRLGKILEALHSIQPSSDSPEERRWAQDSAYHVLGGTGCEDVSEAVIRGESFLHQAREALAKAVRGELSSAEAQNVLERISAGEISLQRLREDRELKRKGFFAFAVRINYHFKRKDILKKFGKLTEIFYRNLAEATLLFCPMVIMVDRIKHTRNHLTHYNLDTNSLRYLKQNDLAELNHKMEHFIWVLLLRELAVPEECVKRAMRTAPNAKFMGLPSAFSD